jgi:hypothetical protein
MNGSEVFIPIVLFLAPVLLIKIISDNRIRHKLIDKGLVDEKVKYLFSENLTLQPLSSVKWGLVLIGIGLALFIGNLSDLHEELIFGLMFIFAGVGFFVYYFLANQEMKKTRE